MLNYRRNTRAAQLNAKSTLNQVLRGLYMSVHADEGETDPPATSSSSSPSQGVDLEKIIAQVRREEKDKLYGKISKLEEENKKLRESNNNYIMQLADYQDRLDKAQKSAQENNTDALNGKIAELEKQLEEEKKNKPDVESIRKEIEAEYEVKLYAKEQFEENKDKILSSFADEVTGKTKEEVDASIAKAVEKSTKIKQELGLIDKDGNPIEKDTKPSGKKDKETPPPAPATKPTTPPAVSPEKSDPKTFTADYVRGLDVKSEEYKEFRKQMGLK